MQPSKALVAKIHGRAKNNTIGMFDGSLILRGGLSTTRVRCLARRARAGVIGGWSYGWKISWRTISPERLPSQGTLSTV